MSSFTILEFEQPIRDLETKLNEFRQLSAGGPLNIADEVLRLETKIQKLLVQIYGKLTPWQKVMVARHPERPHCLDYVRHLIVDFVPLAGDRLFGEDKAMIAGIGRFRGQSAIILGTEKGHDLESRLTHNFGMARPEGYRKATRLMHLADRMSLPVICFVDTSGAYPGRDAEERGQAEAIARATQAMLNLRVPVVSVITGEGGSGGAIALAAANSVLMLEHSIYSVVSPEGCASILWRSADKKQDAAAAQRLTAQDLSQLGIIDAIIPEPIGGAHRFAHGAMTDVGNALEKQLKKLTSHTPDGLRNHRRDKFLTMGTMGLSI